MDFVLDRFSTRFDELQDRVRLDAESTEGQALTLWLTRRLLMRLLPPLLDWLQVRDGTSFSDAIQAFAQSVAMQSPMEAALEPAPKGAIGILVETVEVTQTKAQLSLQFKGEGHGARITLERQGVRQWLGGIHGVLAGAEWDLDCWPAWLASPESLQGDSRVAH